MRCSTSWSPDTGHTSLNGFSFPGVSEKIDRQVINHTQALFSCYSTHLNVYPTYLESKLVSCLAPVVVATKENL